MTYSLSMYFEATIQFELSITDIMGGLRRSHEELSMSFEHDNEEVLNKHESWEK